MAAAVRAVVCLTTLRARSQLPAQRLGPAGEEIRQGPAMAGMCHKVIHDYLGVNIRRVFETVRQDLPSLQSAINRILTDLEKGRKHPSAWTWHLAQCVLEQ